MFFVLFPLFNVNKCFEVLIEFSVLNINIYHDLSLF